LEFRAPSPAAGGALCARAPLLVELSASSSNTRQSSPCPPSLSRSGSSRSTTARARPRGGAHLREKWAELRRRSSSPLSSTLPSSFPLCFSLSLRRRREGLRRARQRGSSRGRQRRDDDNDELLVAAPLLPLLPGVRPLGTGRIGARGGADTASVASWIPLDSLEKSGDGKMQCLLEETAIGGKGYWSPPRAGCRSQCGWSHMFLNCALPLYPKL
jgi:hypothetical protein